LPKGISPLNVVLEPGDTLFFNGSLIHGSTKNSSQIFRKSLVTHFAPRSCEQSYMLDGHLYARDGEIVERIQSPEGGPCGTEYPYRVVSH
jgi:hypothetical protein